MSLDTMNKFTVLTKCGKIGIIWDNAQTLNLKKSYLAEFKNANGLTEYEIIYVSDVIKVQNFSELNKG